ncbi:PREDICTED: probable serine/threonine-protein kinase DDB_G0280111 isoform X2 [Ipomoea nil]|uniref:probable serine/threonine-protein kinase DDB_G0280111 isoform X2 n=1 Tax=Ipomoea nil TaxID=35883 RepID=UPI0009016F97|nr:PREDICTED: probable serine/threonine-protein kinase DDB_G0280111 isoform X2 [Ipomoea nil]
MWRFKPFTAKEQTGLEGRTIDIGNLKVQVRNIIAEGGFSCVYLGRDVIHGSKQYALKHIICNDEESMDLVLKEINVMKSLKGHPNIVTLCAHSIFDMGRTKEALICMEYCEKSLVSVLEGRGSGYFEEKQILTIFRDICNAVFAMHCQSPPIAHRDLKAENLLLGPDGLWKLCDFGSTSTNHKRFEKPEEMGIEEDNIRKHTTPAYRAPEMWDLYRRELINEKVDIWALGCLLFRISYFKSAFDGESKLQILNGNYRIPESPKYSSSIVDLIRDMLQSSPDARPDITQVWFRVNNLLPDGLQKSLPDRSPEMMLQSTDLHEGIPRTASKSNPVPRRTAPPPPAATDVNRNPSPSHNPGMAGAGAGGPLGAFWNTQHAKDAAPDDKTRPKYDEELTSYGSPRNDRTSPSKAAVNRARDASSKDFEINFFPNSSGQNDESPHTSKKPEGVPVQGDKFNAFIAEFSSTKQSSGSKNTGKEDLLEAEVEKLKEQLTHTNMEKAEITSKFEKLSAICRSQRQEIQELKQALAAKTPSPNRDTLRNQSSPKSQTFSTPPQRETIEGTVWELQQGLLNQSSSSPDPSAWQAFADDGPKPLTTPPPSNTPRSMRTRNNQPPNTQDSTASAWGFGTDSFTAVPSATSQMNASFSDRNNSQRFGDKRVDNKSASQPAGWAGF